jgi:hypothetical protein
MSARALACALASALASALAAAFDSAATSVSGIAGAGGRLDVDVDEDKASAVAFAAGALFSRDPCRGALDWCSGGLMLPCGALGYYYYYFFF